MLFLIIMGFWHGGCTRDNLLFNLVLFDSESALRTYGLRERPHTCHPPYLARSVAAAASPPAANGNCEGFR